jgi:uncharacterized protein (DUF302 family)
LDLKGFDETIEDIEEKTECLGLRILAEFGQWI